ncbi:spexin prohormone 2 isoform X2 [Betta splendens]|uniref:Spexin prohormone 2 isoform X2 n=1 Tax=Betta splendens TaxID=158456 RepID=A0A6P7NJA1_BETSP|nr:spexin prohormone 2 isoform X2 [Betta splendens]
MKNGRSELDLSESSSPWFLAGAVFSSMMLEDVHMDYQEDEEGPIITPIVTLRTNRSDIGVQPRERDGWESQVVYNASGGEHAAKAEEPEPLYLTLGCAPIYSDGGPAGETDVSRSPNQIVIPQYQQTAHPMSESSNQKASIYSKLSLEGAAETVYESKSNKFCHCSRSQCLKLYCECFASGVMCSNCHCSNCHNNLEHEVNRQRAIKSRLARDPDAFRPKSGEASGWHKGCTCKRSSCLKNYCECYEANTMCSSRCKCVGCRWKPCQPMDKGATIIKDTWAVSAIAPAVVEDVCSRLLVQAQKAEREAQRMVLNEFGHCLTEIIKTMFK